MRSIIRVGVFGILLPVLAVATTSPEAHAQQATESFISEGRIVVAEGLTGVWTLLGVESSGRASGASFNQCNAPVGIETGTVWEQPPDAFVHAGTYTPRDEQGQMPGRRLFLYYKLSDQASIGVDLGPADPYVPHAFMIRPALTLPVYHSVQIDDQYTPTNIGSLNGDS